MNLTLSFDTRLPCQVGLFWETNLWLKLIGRYFGVIDKANEDTCMRYNSPRHPCCVSMAPLRAENLESLRPFIIEFFLRILDIQIKSLTLKNK